MIECLPFGKHTLQWMGNRDGVCVLRKFHTWLGGVGVGGHFLIRPAIPTAGEGTCYHWICDFMPQVRGLFATG